MSIVPKPGHGARLVLRLRQPVHHRVAAVGEHDEDHADLVARRAPEGLDRVQGRAVADHGHHRAARQRHPDPDRRRQAEAQPAHRRAQEPERLARRQAHEQLRPRGGRLLHQHRVGREALCERRQHVAPAQRLAGRRRCRCGRALHRLGSRPRGLRQHTYELRTEGRGSRQHGQVDRAAVGLGLVVGDHRHSRARLDERAGLVGVLPEHRRAHRQDQVVSRERPAQPPAPGRQVPREARVVLRKAGARAESLLPDRAGQPLRQLDEGRPRVRLVRARADHQHRRARLLDQVGQLGDRRGLGCARVQHAPRRGDLVRLAGRGEPVVHRHDHDRRAARGAGLVPRARERARHVLRAGGLIDPDRVLARQPTQPAGEERLLGEMAAVLLAHQDDERRAVDPRRGQRRHRVAQSRRGVHQDERGLAGADREAARHADQGALVQRQHEAEVVGQPAEERNLRGAGIGEDGGKAALAQDVEGGVAHRPAPRAPFTGHIIGLIYGPLAQGALP